MLVDPNYVLTIEIPESKKKKKNPRTPYDNFENAFVQDKYRYMYLWSISITEGPKQNATGT